MTCKPAAFVNLPCPFVMTKRLICLLLATALAKNAVPFELHIFPIGRHGLGLAEEYADVRKWAELCQAWLCGQGFGK